MTLSSLAAELDRAFPIEKVALDFRSYFFSDTSDTTVSVELEGKSVDIPRDAPVETVSKVLFFEAFDVGFGTSCRVLLAVGGVKAVTHGIAYAHIVFTLLYYNIQGELITAELSDTMP